MFDGMWEAVFRLENLGLKVLAVCCDGLAANRRLFSIHQPGSTTPVYKVPNPHAHNGERRSLFFLSDPPHLIKTVRNCWANYKRELWVSSLLFIYIHISYCMFFSFSILYIFSAMGWTFLGNILLSCMRRIEHKLQMLALLLFRSLSMSMYI